MKWIVGDIHGMLKPLELLLDRIAKRDAQAEIIFCGDYVNRGPESRRVVDLLLTLRNAHFVRGNHDDTFDLLLNGRCFVPHSHLAGIVPTFEHFMKYGLDQTLLSYGIDWAMIDVARRHPSTQALAMLLDPVPLTHREFFRSLKVVHEEKEFFVAHAKWDPSEPAGTPTIAQQLTRSMKLRHDIIWGRFTSAEIGHIKRWERTGFFGHTPVTMYRRSSDILPLMGEKMVLLDTACAINVEGRLTGWCVDEQIYIQADRHGEWVVEAAANADAA